MNEPISINNWEELSKRLWEQEQGKTFVVVGHINNPSKQMVDLYVIEVNLNEHHSLNQKVNAACKKIGGIL